MMSLNQIRKTGIVALTQTLGPLNMVRFLQQFDTGSGDYTKEMPGVVRPLLNWTTEVVKGIEKERIKK